MTTQAQLMKAQNQTCHQYKIKTVISTVVYQSLFIGVKGRPIYQHSAPVLVYNTTAVGHCKVFHGKSSHEERACQLHNHRKLRDTTDLHLSKGQKRIKSFIWVRRTPILQT